MSLFQSETVPCPACGRPVEFNVVYSLNADRRPDLRAAVLDGSFQAEPCPGCGETFRLEPELAYLDVGRKQWILVQPVGKLVAWAELEQQAKSTFAQAYGEKASPGARAIGRDLQVRVTFGWSGLREKVFAAEHALDDVILELLKLTVIRGLPELPLADDTELRLADVEGGMLVLTWIRAATEGVVEVLHVPKAVYDGIAADPAGWQTAREGLTAGPFVDIHRLLVPQEKATAEPAATK
jgi:hypothetical protein